MVFANKSRLNDIVTIVTTIRKLKNKKIFNILKSDKIKVNKIDTKINGNRGSYLECCDQAEKADDQSKKAEKACSQHKDIQG